MGIAGSSPRACLPISQDGLDEHVVLDIENEGSANDVRHEIFTDFLCAAICGRPCDKTAAMQKVPDTIQLLNTLFSVGRPHADVERRRRLSTPDLI
jgi:hypothetical protein